MVETQFGLSQRDIKLIHSVFQSFPQVEEVLIYGSRAIGNYRGGSDIDLTIVAPNFPLAELLKLKIDLDDLNLPYKIDLSIYDQIDNSKLVEHIKRVGLPFYMRS